MDEKEMSEHEQLMDILNDIRRTLESINFNMGNRGYRP